MENGQTNDQDNNQYNNQDNNQENNQIDDKNHNQIDNQTKIYEQKFILKTMIKSHIERFFKSFDKDKRREIFEIIYNSLFKENGTYNREEVPKILNEYINAKDATYIDKTNEDISELFVLKEKELNKKLEKYKIKLVLKDNYYLFLVDDNNKSYFKISCLRNIRFGEEYEWVCSPHYLLYFQYYELKYEKPSFVEKMDITDKNVIEEKVETIDNVSKANQLLIKENFIYIKDSMVQNIDFNKIFEDGKETFTFTKEKIFKYLDYSDHDPKQIIDSDILKNNNYSKILDFCFEEQFKNIIYSFHNGNYFFELNLIICLNSYQYIGYKFFYININKIEKILHNKYSFKQYLGFWLAKLFPDNEISESDIKGNENNDDNKSKFIEFANNLCDSIFKNKKKYLEIILDILNNEFIKLNKIDPDENILVILNNLNPSDIDWIEKKRFINLNILSIFNIQENFDIFQLYYYEETKYKKFFLENKSEISFKEPEKDCKNEKFYSYNTIILKRFSGECSKKD